MKEVLYVAYRRLVIISYGDSTACKSLGLLSYSEFGRLGVHCPPLHTASLAQWLFPLLVTIGSWMKLAVSIDSPEQPLTWGLVSSPH